MINNCFRTFPLLLILLGSGCKKFLTVRTPEGELLTPNVFKNDSTATAAIIGVYERISSNKVYFPSGYQSISLLAGLSADELDCYSNGIDVRQFYLNAISSNNNYITAMWKQLYESIYQCNSVLEGLTASSTITLSLKRQLSGEALFLRAFFYFYLTNLFGPVPLALSTTYQVNDTLHRSPVEVVYNQVKNDLVSASQLLSNEYPSGTERIRANQSAAYALLARVYLYTRNWQQSVASASLVINRIGQYQLCQRLTDVFLKNSAEAILQLQPTAPRYNTFDAEIFIFNSYPTLAACSRQLLGAFEATDKRLSAWLGNTTVGADTFYFPYKYKVRPDDTIREYLMVLRLSELYLIRAECFVQLGMEDSALVDVNAIRARSGLTPLSAISAQVALQAIYKERQVELFAEWGHRWLDLKRTGRIDQVLGLLKSPEWKSSDALYPIPQSEIELNPHLVQNAGY